MNFVPLVEPGSRATEAEGVSRPAGRAGARDQGAGIDRKDPKTQERARPSLSGNASRLETSVAASDVPGSYAVTEGKPLDVPLQRRGEPGEPGPGRPARRASVRVSRRRTRPIPCPVTQAAGSNWRGGSRGQINPL